MAVYKVFLEKTATLFSNSPIANSGRDEIVELVSTQGSGAARFLSKVNTDAIKNVVNELIQNQNYSASLDFYIAYATEIPEKFSIITVPISTIDQTGWDRGNGKKQDIPVNTSGVSWRHRKAFQEELWTDSISGSITGSYLDENPGGGTWKKEEENTVLFENHKCLDLNIEITSILKEIVDGNRVNEGFITRIKNDLGLGSEENVNLNLRYFGRDTNTVFPPCITLKWDDSVYAPVDEQEIQEDLITVKVKNNRGAYNENSIQTFQLAPRPTYPTKRFRETSTYLTNYRLPEETYWSIKDEHSEEVVIDFQESTKVSLKDGKTFFKIYMNGLQPERFYRILIKTVIAGSEIVIDDDNIFKLNQHE